jgi:hypothetical protein
MSDKDSVLRVAVVTGGHSFDVPGFHALFRRVPEAQVCIQHMDDFASSPAAVRDAYDVLLFYTMLREGPSDTGLPWYAGKPLTALGRLGTTPQGIFVLHHALLAYTSWPPWGEMVGLPAPRSTPHMGQTIRIAVTGPHHPITAGLSGWEITDETYETAEPGPGSEVLLTTDHPKSMRSLAWTRRFGRSRVFCFQSGHGRDAWENPRFVEVLRRGILWCSGRPDGTREGKP